MLKKKNDIEFDRFYFYYIKAQANFTRVYDVQDTRPGAANKPNLSILPLIKYLLESNCSKMLE